ncbi:MAG: hypothetical protein KGI27_09940 [Thaumarchaeota archaeon]|nr:hypothetical protein [Nitrososphaerota archaeon]
MAENQSKEGGVVAYPEYLPSKTLQPDFSGALNAQGAPHLIGANEVQTSTNIDYSLEWGGAPARLGEFTYAWESTHGTTTSAINIQLIGRNYALSQGVWSDNLIPWVAGADSGVTYLGTGTAQVALASATGYAGGSTSLVFPVITAYNSYVYVGNGTSAFRTNGTNTLDWLLPQADTPTVSFAQQGTFTGTGNQAGAAVLWTGTWTATEGSVTANGTSSYFGNPGGVIVSTCTTGTGSRIVVIGTNTGSNWENPVTFITNPTGTTITGGAGGTYTLGGAIDFHQGWPSGDLSGGSGTYTGTATVTQTLTIGVYGTDYILLGLFDQQSVVSIQRDLSIGDTTFTNYWHSETTPSSIADAATDPLSLMLTAQGTGPLDNQVTALNQSRLSTPVPRRGIVPSPLPAFRKTASKASTNAQAAPWATARTDYQFIGTLPTPDFSNIKAVRVTVEFSSTGHQALVGGVVTYGAQGWCLNDQATGISYFQTFARVENGVIVAEGAPSNPSPPTKAQYAYGMLTCTSNTNTTAGITHRCFYRTGGLLQDAYRVGSCTITSGTATIYDYANPDMAVLARPVLRRFLWSQWPSPSAGTGLPGVNCISEPFLDRIFVGVSNYLYWSYPGQPSQINDASQVTVGNTGDPIMGLIPYTNLVIVTQASVYEMGGTIFEGTGQDWWLQKSGSRRGSAAPKTVIKTPFGILLFSFDGISFYRQGYGVDQDLSWVYDKIGDLWKGTSATDPAALKGRIPALNQTAIYNSCAAYRDEKIYLAVPTGTNTQPDTVFVLDIPRQKVAMYTYPFKVNSLFWDRVGNRIFAGTDKGTIQQLEEGLVDTTPANVAQGIAWHFKSRTWTTPRDLIFENLQVENVGTSTVSATVDGVGLALNTFSNTSKTWTPCSIQGTIGDAITFDFTGTQSGTFQEIYQMQWDMVPQGAKVSFFKTDYLSTPAQNYVKTWLAEIDLNGTATVTATLLGDGTALTLANGGTSTALSGYNGKKWFEISLPNPTTAKVLQAVYQSSSTSPFKYYDTEFEYETKPFEKYTWLVTYKKIGGATQADMLRFYAMDIEGTLTATVTATWIVDGSAVTTNTFTISSSNAGENTGDGRIYADQIPMPPGVRGYLFQQQLTSAQPFRVWKAHVDIDRIGVKGLSRISLTGTPTEQQRQ